MCTLTIASSSSCYVDNFSNVFNFLIAVFVMACFIGTMIGIIRFIINRY